jgi:endo-1,4-beta-xylanase
MPVNGVQDDAINLTDIMQIANSFNTSSGDSRYVENSDLNRDGAVNMNDIMIVAGHFNKVPGNY